MFKAKLLIVPLTSGDIHRLDRCLYTIENLIPVQENDIEISYDIKIVVNTKDESYAKLVQETYGDRYEIEITESDGTPGTGKNSVFDYFRKQKKRYDYLFQVDGDDMLYPTALIQLSKYFKDGWDVVSFQSMDWLSTNFTKQMSHAPVIPDKLWLYSWCDQEINIRQIAAFEYVTDDGFGTKGGRIFTPGTSMVLSRKMLKNHADVRHTNEIKLFEDYLYFLKLFNLHIKEKIRMCSVNNSYIYIYDRTNENSISTNNCYYGKKELGLLRGFCEENKIMDKHPKTDMPFIRIGKPNHADRKDKIFWIRHLISRYPAIKMHSLDHNKQKKMSQEQMNNIMNAMNRVKDIRA